MTCRISEILTSIYVNDDGASWDSASARVIHFASSSGSRIWTCRCSASNQQSCDSSSSEGYSESHRCEGLGRPKEFSGREEDFQQWSKKTEAFFAGVIKEAELMLEWPLSSRRKSRRRRLISSSCRRTRTRKEECQTWSFCCSRCTQHS